MYGCESWTIKKTERWRIDAFELWCWIRLLRVSWTARRSNQSILKISPGYSLEALMLKLQLWYFCHLVQKASSSGKDPDAGKEDAKGEQGGRDSILKIRDITLPTKVRLVKPMVFPVVMYRCELDYEESWAPKNWCFWTAVLEKTLESPMDCKEIQPVHPKRNQSQIFIGRTDAETPILWPPHAKSWLIGKDSDAGRDWGQEKKGTTEDEMAGWHQWLNGHESE